MSFVFDSWESLWSCYLNLKPAFPDEVCCLLQLQDLAALQFLPLPCSLWPCLALENVVVKGWAALKTVFRVLFPTVKHQLTYSHCKMSVCTNDRTWSEIILLCWPGCLEQFASNTATLIFPLLSNSKLPLTNQDAPVQ